MLHLPWVQPPPSNAKYKCKSEESTKYKSEENTNQKKIQIRKKLCCRGLNRRLTLGTIFSIFSANTNTNQKNVENTNEKKIQNTNLKKLCCRGLNITVGTSFSTFRAQLNALGSSALCQEKKLCKTANWIIKFHICTKTGAYISLMQQPSVQKSQFGNLDRKWQSSHYEEATAKFDNKDCYAAAEETCYNIGWRSLDPYISSPMAWRQCIVAWQATAMSC